MVDINKVYDVFISHAARDVTTANDVADACRDGGLEAVTAAELPAGEEGGDALRDALVESRALLLILSPSGPTPAMSIEIGAAWAWSKPIHAIVTDPASTRLPPSLSGIRLYTPGRLQDVIEAIKSGARQMDGEDRAFLAELYAGMGLPIDQLATEPRQLAGLVKDFQAGRGKAIAGDRLLLELMRMRKQGTLAMHRPTGRRAKREPV